LKENFERQIISFLKNIFLLSFLQRVIEGKIEGGIEVTGRRGRKRRKLLDDLKERRGYSHLKEEALDRTMWRARFGRGLGPVVRQTTK
jgi:hypothetical protein